ncbi:PAS domain S-box protein [Microcoleus sp. FACHB-831]|uniref:PAS domain-containing sensor histidine kinase n=1 Tax=Microcoleus sp. FACHB-831 TaxID=2692827 RepID=UPI001685887E|nr:PAS domain S-box protein [Microcoleus sp. FACHB-831]MBD1920211.1 PAS domain S-box protein [Microcoleus sp. FACHB-831]
MIPNSSQTSQFLVKTTTRQDLETQVCEEGEQLLQAVFNNATMGIVVLDVDLTIVEVNPTLAQWLGYSAIEMQGRCLGEFISKEEAIADKKLYREVVVGERDSYQVEKRFCCREGQWLWANLTVSLVRNAKGKPQYVMALVENVTSRHLMQAEIEQQTQIFDSILSALPDYIYVCDRAGKYIYVNSSGAAAFGLAKHEILGKNWQELNFSYRLTDGLKTDMEAVFKRGKAIKGEIDFLTVDGTAHSEYLLSPVASNDGGIEAVVVTIRDKSDRKQIQEALEDSEQKFQKLAANVPGVIYQFLRHPDGSSSFVYVSSGCRELYELEPEEIQQNSNLMWERIHPDHLQSLQQSIEVSCKTMMPWNWEGKIVLPSGKIKWIQGASRPERQANGDILWDGLIVDISDRKLVESVLQHYQQRLEEIVSLRTAALTNANLQLQQEIAERKLAEEERQKQEDLYRTLAKNFPNGAVFLFDLDLRFTIAEGMGLAEVGLSKQLLEGKTIQEVFPPDCYAQVEPYYRAALAGKATVFEQACGEIIYQVHAIPVKNDRGEVFAGMIVAQDITIAKHAEAQLKEQATELQQALQDLKQTHLQLVHSEKMSSLGQLLAGVAHEINNPVNFIYGNITHASQYTSDLLGLLQLYQQQYPHSTPEIEDEIQAIDLDFLVKDLPKLLSSMKVGAERISEIVLSLRNFSRSDEAAMKVVDIHEGLDSTLLMLQNRIKAKPEHPAIVLIKDYGKLPLVECNPGQINQVFMNLISNALDALEESIGSTQTAPCIQIRTEVIEGATVAIKIADNGSGMKEEVRRRLFDPFFTTKPIGKGTGLGLSISHEIVVEKHVGKLYCQSELSKGTEFTIEIPIKHKQ